MQGSARQHVANKRNGLKTMLNTFLSLGKVTLSLNFRIDYLIYIPRYMYLMHGPVDNEQEIKKKPLNLLSSGHPFVNFIIAYSTNSMHRPLDNT